jgi:hypothetical protein
MEKCCICHELLENKTYSLPECSHIFHINCIMHWWRAGHNKCPLCNNIGVNGNELDPIIHETVWDQRMNNYKKLRLLSRKKSAPEYLKKQVQQIKKIEEQIKKQATKFKEWKKQISTNLTNRKIASQNWQKKHYLWKLKHRLKMKKLYLGACQKIIPIIIATKLEV